MSAKRGTGGVKVGRERLGDVCGEERGREEESGALRE